MSKFSPQNLRQYLVTFTLLLSYAVFTVFGVIVAKYEPRVIAYIDLASIPIGLSLLLLFYMFALTYEKKIEVKLNPNVHKCAKLYAEGYSFANIQEIMELSNPNEVKRMLTDFCKYRS